MTTEWILTEFVLKWFLHWVVSKQNKKRPVNMASITKNSKMWNWKYLNGIIPTLWHNDLGMIPIFSSPEQAEGSGGA